MTDLEMRKQIAAFIDGQATVGDLEDWLESEAWDDQGAPLIARRLAHDVLRILNEHDSGDWSEGEVAEKLGILSRSYWFEQAPKTVLTGSDSESLFIDPPRSAGPDRRLGEVSA